MVESAAPCFIFTKQLWSPVMSGRAKMLLIGFAACKIGCVFPVWLNTPIETWQGHMQTCH